MDVNEPGLFDLPDREPPARAERLQRGRNRETWAWTVTAEVAIIDADAVRGAALRARENAVTVDWPADPNVQDAPLDSEVNAAADLFDEVAGLIWPTSGLEGPLAAGAFRIVSVDCAAVAASDDRGSLTWTVAVKLTDVHELRRLAAQAHPDEAGLIADSLAVAWQRAADPYAPVRSIRGTAWRPGQVEVRHLPRRARPSSAEPH